jgi:ArsR family transcriptional regulator
MNQDEIEYYAEIFKALGHPTRLSLVMGLMRVNECNVNKMVSNLGLSQSTISQHLALLRRVGVVKHEKKGLEVCYRIDNPKIRNIIEVVLTGK